ncbi:PAS domain-containing sensor histidine kinase [Devosia sp. YIM 151766]|uniref:sensor histidine kinase NtrY-like n=1 Tax=Devosia sp. YIM 151766 TaxID=3017325 RepID=UPI00255CA552|nr:PAS domain-containing sensor histidine kinase [Devosia sp. YIM 151766]WIY54353.1 PAS domain-containing sensor histidine kinase [Devosia sp. YIM 151766]
MADLVSATDKQAIARPAEARPWRRPFMGMQQDRALRVLGFGVVFASVLMSTMSFLILSDTTGIEPSPGVWTIIWIVTGILVLLVIALVVTEAVLLLQARMRRAPGSGLQVRMVTMFAFVAAVPAALVAVVATIALNQGLDQWFSERTRAMVESSRLVARSYMLEHAQVLRDDIIWVATELEQAHSTFENDPERFERILTALAVTRSLPFTSLIDRNGGTFIRAQINVAGAYPRLPDGITQGVVEGIPTAIAPGTTNLVGSVIKLRGYDETYLFVARPVDAEVLQYMRLTDENITEYREYASNRLVFQITFTIMYVGLAVVLLLAALWIGIALANRFVDPIRNLMIASRRVSSGDLDVQVPVQEGRGDLRDLSNGFNRMIQQLKTQREELLKANEVNEKRRQFTEAVVEGVSAGIIGLDPFGAVTLVNARACEMLGKTEIELMGERMEAILPEIAPTMEKARSARRGQVRDQIQLGNETDRRIYQVQLTREGSITESKGYVLTFDDITDLESAQRTSAWADVARRIAHEIKNPLTPIQLSAERLRRRYGNKLEDDREVFDKCINTIVRQVGDIGRMVDEFSAFARMPESAPEMADLSDTVRQAVFLESVRLPEVNIVTLLPDDAIHAWFDNRLVSQVLTNLIKNAVEAFEGIPLSEEWQPTIIVEAHIEDNHARVAVSDNGKGWPGDNRQRLLEPYMTTREKGTGLGLAIVARIIEQHGGIVELIDAEPDPQGRTGACVTFTLPLHSPAKATSEDEAAAADITSSQQEEPPLSAVVQK